MEILGYLASFAMGLTLGLMGGGGSILTVPILVYLYGLNPTAAAGHSLFVVGFTALIGGAMYIRKGEFDFQAGLAFALPSAIGVNVARGLILPAIPETIVEYSGFVLTKDVLVMMSFAFLMVFASYSMIKKRQLRPQGETSSPRRTVLIGIQGLTVGLIAGFVGAGGGFLIIPALVLLARLPMRVAVGTSLMIIALQSLVGFGGDLLRGSEADWPLLLTISALAVAGITVGSAFAQKINEQKLKSAFGWFVLVMGTGIIAEQIRHLFLK